MIYHKVINYCKDNNMSISAFEKKCDLANGTVSGWNKGKPGNPSIETLTKIVNATNTDYSYWLDDSE